MREPLLVGNVTEILFNVVQKRLDRTGVIVLLMPLPTHRSDLSKEKQKYYRGIPILEQGPAIIQL